MGEQMDSQCVGQRGQYKLDTLFETGEREGGDRDSIYWTTRPERWSQDSPDCDGSLMQSSSTGVDQTILPQEKLINQPGSSQDKLPDVEPGPPAHCSSNAVDDELLEFLMNDPGEMKAKAEKEKQRLERDAEAVKQAKEYTLARRKREDELKAKAQAKKKKHDDRMQKITKRTRKYWERRRQRKQAFGEADTISSDTDEEAKASVPAGLTEEDWDSMIE